MLDETAELKKGAATADVARQHAGITGQVENCQTVVFAAYVTARAHALLDFRLYLPKSWCADQARLEKAHIPDDTAFITKPALGAKMITGAGRATGSRSPGWPPTRFTAAARSCGRHARRPGRGTCSRSR